MLFLRFALSLSPMNETRKYLNQYAMRLGTYMGVFWILKFCLIPLGMTRPFLMLLFIGLTLCVPFMGFYYVRLYRDRVLGGNISFGHALLFSFIMYIYASLLVGAAHYVYFAFIDQGYLIDIYTQTLDRLEAAPQVLPTESYIPQLREALEVVAGLSPISLTMQLMSNNNFYGMILSVISAALLRRNVPETKKEE